MLIHADAFNWLNKNDSCMKPMSLTQEWRFSPVRFWRLDLENSIIVGWMCDNCLTFYTINFSNVRDVTDPEQPKQQDF